MTLKDVFTYHKLNNITKHNLRLSLGKRKTRWMCPTHRVYMVHRIYGLWSYSNTVRSMINVVRLFYKFRIPNYYFLPRFQAICCIAVMSSLSLHALLFCLCFNRLLGWGWGSGNSKKIMQGCQHTRTWGWQDLHYIKLVVDRHQKIGFGGDENLLLNVCGLVLQ